MIARDNSAVYVAETYWSRGSRGDRTDVVTFYDSRTLEVTGEVLLPRGRFLVVTKKYNAGLTTSPEQVAPGFPSFTAKEVGQARHEPLRERAEKRAPLLLELHRPGLIEAGEDALGASPERRADSIP